MKPTSRLPLMLALVLLALSSAVFASLEAQHSNEGVGANAGMRRSHKRALTRFEKYLEKDKNVDALVAKLTSRAHIASDGGDGVAAEAEAEAETDKGAKRALTRFEKYLEKDKNIDALVANLTTRSNTDDGLRFAYGGPQLGGKMVRGVSIGGWLVLENFITPSVFDATGPENNGIVDEWTFGSKQSKAKGTAILQKHLNTFITESDFVDIAAAGLNHVRIPIGFWAFDVQGKEPYLKLNQWDLLKQACIWAGNHGIRVLVDLHGVPGSQNGFDHSGRLGGSHFADKQSYIDRALDIIETMATEFAKSKYSNSVASIEVVNEPLGVPTKTLKKYYKDAYARIHKHTDAIAVVISDKFIDPQNSAWASTWEDFMHNDGYNDIIEDSHQYTVFSEGQIQMNAQARQDSYCSKANSLKSANTNKWQVVGEWTAAFTDCARSLNGRGKGARYDASYPGVTTAKGSCTPKRGPASGFSDGYKELLGRFFQVQRDTYEKGSGWIYWTWKTESTGEDWSYKAGMQYGWIPAQATGSVSTYRC